jgi:hypothetical protein
MRLLRRASSTESPLAIRGNHTARWFYPDASAAYGIEMVHMMRKGKAKYAYNLQLSLAEQFNILAA